MVHAVLVLLQSTAVLYIIRMRVCAIKLTSLALSSFRRVGLSARLIRNPVTFGSGQAYGHRRSFYSCRSMKTSPPVLAASSAQGGMARQLKVAHILLPADQEDAVMNLKKRIEGLLYITLTCKSGQDAKEGTKQP